MLKIQNNDNHKHKIKGTTITQRLPCCLSSCFFLSFEKKEESAVAAATADEKVCKDKVAAEELVAMKLTQEKDKVPAEYISRII